MTYSIKRLLSSNGDKFVTNDKSSIYLIAAGIPEATIIYRDCPLRHLDVKAVMNIAVIDAVVKMGGPSTYAIFEQPCDSKDYELRAIVKNNECLNPGQLTIEILEKIFNAKIIDKKPIGNDKLNNLVNTYNNTLRIPEFDINKLLDF